MLRPFSTAIVFSVWAAAAQAQTAHESESVRADPKALLEWVWGSNAGKKETDQSGEEDRLDPDRPHFPEASTTVGKGRSILERGTPLLKMDRRFSPTPIQNRCCALEYLQTGSSFGLDRTT